MLFRTLIRDRVYLSAEKREKTWKIIFTFNHLSQIFTDKLRRKIVRKLVRKLNIISKYTTLFGHTS